MEPVYIIPKEEFLENINKALENCTHVGVPVERVEVFGIEGGGEPNGCTVLGIGMNLNSFLGLANMMALMFKPNEDGWQPFCNDKQFIADAELKAAEARERMSREELARNTELASIAQTLQQDSEPEGLELAAVMGLIQTAVNEHEAKKDEQDRQAREGDR